MSQSPPSHARAARARAVAAAHRLSPPAIGASLVGVVLVAAAIALLSRGLWTPAPARATARGAVLTPAPIVGHPAPNATLLDLSGNQVQLSSFRGQVVVLNFWYTGCEACQFEMPILERVYHADQSRGLVVVGINVVDDAQTIAAYLATLGVDYRVLRDTDQRATLTYRISSTPTTFVIGRHGVIRAQFVGAITDTRTLTRVVGPLLATG